MKPRGALLRPWAEAAIALVLIFVTAAFAMSILDSQAAYSDDRAGLQSLKESWSAVAGNYGLRGDRHASVGQFSAEYRLYRERPSVTRLVKVDPQFKLAAASVDEAFARLELAEYFGSTGSMLYVTRAAANLDRALDDMVLRIADYSRERLAAARLSLVVLIVLIVSIGGTVVLLERRVMLEDLEVVGNRALAAALISAQEEERLRISHELHDAVAQDLAAARLYCDLAFSAPPAGESQAGAERATSDRGADARKASDLLARAIGEIREICQGLRPAELDRLGISKACGRLCAETASISGLEVGFSARGFELIEGREIEVLGEALAINMYRILQESLTNVRRHAKASRVDVTLEYVPTALRLRVEDDGIGTGAARPGMGRRGMEERARMLGGLFSIGQSGSGGTVVSATIPVPQRETS